MIDLAVAARPLPPPDCSAGSIAVLLLLKISLWTIKSGGKKPCPRQPPRLDPSNHKSYKVISNFTEFPDGVFAHH